MNSKLSTLFIIILSLVAAALFFKNGELLWLAFPFLIYLGIGLLQFPTADHIHIEAQRRITQPEAISRSAADGSHPGLEMEVIVRNRGAAIPSLHLEDLPLEGIKIISGQPFLQAAVPQDGELIFKYSFVHKRGQYQWDAVRARVSDPFRLLSTVLTLPAPEEIAVHPDRDDFRRLQLRVNSTLHSPGTIPAKLAGSGTDFWGVRLYQPGDSLRKLDWRLSARHPGKFFSREFEKEEVADIGLILDARGRTDLHIGDESLFEHSVRACASLAEGFIYQGQRVSLLALSQNILQVFPGYGKGQLQRILRCLSGVQTGSATRISSLEYLPLRMFSNRTLVVVLSPLARNDHSFFRRLRAYGCQALLISPDPFDFSSSILPEDAVSQQSFRLARLERSVQLQAIAGLQVKIIDWQVSQPLYPLVRSALGRSRGQRER